MLNNLARSTHTRPPQKEWVQRSDTEPSDHARASCPPPRVIYKLLGTRIQRTQPGPCPRAPGQPVPPRAARCAALHWPPSFPRPCTRVQVWECPVPPRPRPRTGLTMEPQRPGSCSDGMAGGPGQGRPQLSPVPRAHPREPFPAAHTGPRWCGGERQRPRLGPGLCTLTPAGLAGAWGHRGEGPGGSPLP